MRFRARRVVVKARVVKLKGVESQAVAAHLRYLQREGVTIDAGRGRAYSAMEDEADPKVFAERGSRTATNSGSLLLRRMVWRSGA